MKKKTLTLLSIFLVVATLTFADNVPFDIAQQLAKNYYAEKSGLKQSDIIFEEAITVEEAGENSYYIFNLKEGFIIISAEDNFIPVIGYSLENSFVTENQPANLSDWMQTYTDQIMYIKENNIQADTKIEEEWKTYTAENFKPHGVSKGVDPMVNHITWNQDGGSSSGWGDGWNGLCPENAGANAVTGCVATAMSIIMYYWQYPIQGTGDHSYYLYPYGTISANFGDTDYMWSNMLDASPTYYSALLSHHAGVAVDMGYGAASSGAFSHIVPVALDDYFGYGNASFVRKMYYTHTEWTNLIKAQLDNGYPIYYSGRDDANGGHAFVCSGYDDSDNFHFNFGWGGSANGFYTLYDVGSFHNDQAAVINIYPTGDDYNVSEVGYNNAPAQNFVAEALEEPTEFFTVEMSWDAPATKALTGYDIYRGTEIIESDLSVGTTTYTDATLENGIIEYYAVRAKYDNGVALASSDLVEGVFSVKFLAKDADTGDNILGVIIQFNEQEKTTGFVGALFSLTPFGHNYAYTAEKTGYIPVSDVIPCVYQTEEFDIIMGQGINDIVEVTKDINLYPNPSKGGIFNIENIVNNSHLVVFDITGKAVYQAQIVNTNKAVINLSHLPKGVYQIQINSTEKQTTKSIIIQ